ncbi:MAG TPA: PAS domain S-box protein [Melioribacteraceae bacterium]|nr:PAS domain S-box protein [Melioribacteraceae bacterium]
MNNTDTIIKKIFEQTELKYIITNSVFETVFYSKGFANTVNKKFACGINIFEILDVGDTIDFIDNIKKRKKIKTRVQIFGEYKKHLCIASKYYIKEEGEYYLFNLCVSEEQNSIISSQMILDSIPMPVFFENEIGEIINCNMAFEKLINKPRNTILSTKNKTKALINACSVSGESNNNLRVVREEKIIKNSSGEKKVYVLVKSPYLNKTMKYGGKVGVYNDITNERLIYDKLIINENKTKEAELLFRNLWDDSLDGFRLVDKRGIIKLVNEAYCNLVAKDKDELLERKFTIVYSETEKRIYNKFKLRLSTNAIKEHSEDFIKLWNGKEIWMESLNKIIYIKGIPHVLSIFRDVTKRHEIESELKAYLNYESLISKLNENYFSNKIENINEVLTNNLEVLGNYLKVQFVGMFLKKGNRMQLISNWYENKSKKNKTYLDHNNIIANLKIFKLLNEGNIIIIEKDDEQLLNEFRILRNDLINYEIEIIAILPLFENGSLLGYIGIEGNKNRFEELSVTLPKLKRISENFVNLVIRNKNYKLIKREKDELETILSTIIDGVITINKYEVIVHANDAVYKIFGKEKGLFMGKNMRYFASLFLQPKESEYREESIKFYDFMTSFKSGTNSFTLLNENGEIKILNVSITNVNNSVGEIDGYIYIIWDMTEKINTEKKVAFSQKMEAIGQLSAGIAHEINTPMQYINDNNRFLTESLNYFNSFVNELMNNSFIKSGNVPVDYIKQIIEKNDLKFYLEEGISATSQSNIGIERVINIIKVMKEFSHPGKVSKTITDINNCIDVSTTISKNAWKYFADLELKLEPKLPTIICNAQEINQVLLNFIVNSAQAIEEAIKLNFKLKGKIIIETTKEKDYIKIKITDDGIGIKQENLNKIFDMFFTTKEVGKGSGQGLAISYDIIVNKHGGKIEVESKYTLGTSFIIYLPIN